MKFEQRFSLESRPTVKDAHSPAGQAFHAPVSYADLPDCPVCKYGTPMERDGKLICIDCKAVVGTVEKK
jgi:hypothetical protein